MKRACVDGDDADDDESFMDEEDDDESFMDEEEDDDMTIAIGDGSETLEKRKCRRYKVVESDESDDSRLCQKLDSIKIEQRIEDVDESANEEHKKKLLSDDVEDAEKKKTCLHEDREKESYIEEWRSEAKKEEEELDEELKQRKLRIEAIALNVEARMMNVEKDLAVIRDWKSRGIKIKKEGTS
ncbi:hypothetical protein AALP_AA4G051900 [Arabis alpina]|uniref:Uncharacterized protein n=1 Tax=Arabis alpina TaxID=50452 RepID=A0A087H1A6_ARAAL|nr:hypothetical protein AALP_AA4G051900 [Arabis alpina]